MNKKASRAILVLIGLALFGLGFYSGHEIYGRNASKNWVDRIESVLYMANSGAEAKEAWVLSTLAKDIEQRPSKQSREAICKLLAIKVSKMKEGHASHLEFRKVTSAQSGSDSEEMFANDVASAEHALKSSGCP